MPFQVKWIEKALNTTKTLPRLEMDWYAEEGAKRIIWPLWFFILHTSPACIWGTFFFLSMLFSWDGVPVKKGFQSSSANWLSSPFFFFKKEINKIYFKRALKNYN